MSRTRSTSLRIVVVGLVTVALGVLLLFLPISADYRGAELECGSAAAPSSAAQAGIDCSVDERRFAAVATMAGGALIAVVAGLWPALRGTRAVSAPQRSAHTST